MRTFIGFGQKQYIGIPQSQAVKLAGIASTIIPLLFQWLAYGASTAVPNINVLVDMSAKNCTGMDQIRSVYIDNLGSDNPIYVYFPDSQYTVVAKPNSEGWYPVFTNQKTMWVIGEGFLTGSIPQTSIIVSNLFIPPQVNTEIDNAVALWKASPTITRGTTIYNSSLGIPALGDQTAQYVLDLAANTIRNMFGSPFASGFITLTGLAVNVIAPSNAVATNPLVLIESTGVAGNLYSLQFAVGVGGAFSVPVLQNLCNLSGMQIKLDATQQWRARIPQAIAGGNAQIITEFTIGPQ